MHGMPTCRLTPRPLNGTFSSVTSILGGVTATGTGAGRSRGGGSNACAGCGRYGEVCERTLPAGLPCAVDRTLCKLAADMGLAASEVGRTGGVFGSENEAIGGVGGTFGVV